MQSYRYVCVSVWSCACTLCSAQRGGPTHLPSATVQVQPHLWPYLWCVADSALAARPRTHAVQNRGGKTGNVQSMGGVIRDWEVKPRPREPKWQLKIIDLQLQIILYDARACVHTPVIKWRPRKNNKVKSCTPGIRHGHLLHLLVNTQYIYW